MKAYKDWAPTPFDCKGLSLQDRQDWLVVPIIRTRDSGILEASNFECAWSRIEDASVADNELSCESHRLGHWGPGWFEIILVRPGSKCAAAAEEIVSKLEDYPLLDEEDHSRREWELAVETWAGMSVKERVQTIRLADNGISVFAARRNELPQGDDNGALFERLTREC